MVTVRHYCSQPKNFDSTIETSVLSSASIYFSFVKDGEDDVDTPCWVQLDVLPAMEQGKGNVTQGEMTKECLNVTHGSTRKTFKTCNVARGEDNF